MAIFQVFLLLFPNEIFWKWLKVCLKLPQSRRVVGHRLQNGISKCFNLSPNISSLSFHSWQCTVQSWSRRAVLVCGRGEHALVKKQHCLDSRQCSIFIFPTNLYTLEISIRKCLPTLVGLTMYFGIYPTLKLVEFYLFAEPSRLALCHGRTRLYLLFTLS